MSDEPADDGDSGSDGQGAPSRSGSEPRDDADESADPPDEDAHVEHDGEADVDGGSAPGADDRPASEADERPATDADEGTATDADESAGTDADGRSGTDADEAPESAPSDSPPAAPAGRPGYTDDHVTAGNDSADDASEAAEDADTDPSDHAPIGTQAPSPDEGPTTTVTDATGTGGGGGGGGSSILSGGIGGSAPPDDQEMPLTEHIEEMLTRLAIVVVVASLAMLAAFPFANDVIIHMWYDVHNGSVEACQTAPQSDSCVAPHVYGPLELVLTRIRVAGLVGLLVALPLAVYQIYRFMRPGLYPHERRYYLAAVPFSLLLGIVGMVFAYFVLLPLLFEYFITYTEGSADLAFQLAETMNLILLMMGMLAIIFQIPLLIMLAILMGITTRRWLERRRLYFWGLFLGVAVIFGPDPTGMAPFLLTATMVALFEGTLLLLRWTGR